MVRLWGALAVMLLCVSAWAGPTIDQTTKSAVEQARQGVESQVSANSTILPTPEPTPISIRMEGSRVLPPLDQGGGDSYSGGSRPQRPAYLPGGGSSPEEYEAPARLWQAPSTPQYRYRANDVTPSGPTPAPDTTPIMDFTPLATQAQSSLTGYLSQILPIVSPIICLMLGISVLMLILGVFRKGG